MNNEEKNTYVKRQITKTLLKLLEEKSINDISIKELCDKAMIGRASFYRNYNTKEDVVAAYTHDLIISWGQALENNPSANILNFFEHLFNHFTENSSFYLMLHKQGLSLILLEVIKKKMELTSSLEISEAYRRSWLAYGIFGLIEEWIAKGMVESPSEMNTIILNNLNLNKS